jgi:hypothetical protein
MFSKVQLSRILFIAIMACSLSVPVNAQDPDPGPHPGLGGLGGDPTGLDGLGDPDVEVPFDGGLSILLMTGAAYGAKKVVTYRKNMASVVNKG